MYRKIGSFFELNFLYLLAVFLISVLYCSLFLNPLFAIELLTDHVAKDFFSSLDDTSFGFAILLINWHILARWYLVSFNTKLYKVRKLRQHNKKNFDKMDFYKYDFKRCDDIVWEQLKPEFIELLKSN